MADTVGALNGLSPPETIGPPVEDTTQLALLDDLKAQATLKYSVKDYDAAAELYSQGTYLWSLLPLPTCYARCKAFLISPKAYIRETPLTYELSTATELQAKINGEMSAQNADLLYAYGRCLYHYALKSSDVLGSKVAGEKQEDGLGRAKGKKAARDNGAVSPN